MAFCILCRTLRDVRQRRGSEHPGPTVRRISPENVRYCDPAPEIFAYFVHDLITVERGASISTDFFVVRAAETPKPE